MVTTFDAIITSICMYVCRYKTYFLISFSHYLVHDILTEHYFYKIDFIMKSHFDLLTVVL